ncbi:DNA repair protein RecN (Recombination protein N) [Chitinophaga skermanii]|uniref:DNA repair protein RecN n=1 Tax=Chitinophaga skermanii TaxID=331697 RepID=A0A327Q6G6_9BACT|nr:DNA repair protein RecN [Chitinophaga skermanii]RAI99890.1 DNA repair protein RecN (Recombination protein N) [Chitinophaga skermanii]
MLQRLIIQNYAIIEHLEVDFSGNLNVITGETGAGKSILLGALSLILGDRADPGVLFDKDRKCVIEGIFTVRKQQIQPFFEEHELDIEGEQVIIRREISSAGKSRAFINDTPVNLSQLSDLTSFFVDLHQQFDTLDLGLSEFQREVIDTLSLNAEVLHTYSIGYAKYLSTQQSLANAIQLRDDSNKTTDYNKFLLDELVEANFSENEIEQADADLKVLSHSEEIKNTLNRIYYQLEEDEQPILQTLKQLQSSLQSLANFHKDIPSLAGRMQSSYVELQDITQEIERLNDQVNFDGAKMEQLSDRLALGYKLFKKHGVQTTNELLAIQQHLQEGLDNVLNLDDKISQLEKELAQQQSKLQQQADAITKRRAAQVTPFEQKVNELLVQVGMPNARIKVSMNTTALGPFGQDEIVFLFDANKSNHFAPIRKVASGGELSRLMLCIKSLVASKEALPTLIFDEIDTGISGEAAKQVGIIMKELAKAHQVICITHQPQIAGKADAHYFVYKKTENQKVTSHIRVLSREERIQAIAQMLGGEKPTAAALENAREMVMN